MGFVSHGKKPGRVPKGFMHYVEKTETCWLWRGCTTDGYGRYTYKGRAERAHRVSYDMHKGPVSRGLVIMHTCDIRRCVNPDHLEAGTLAENNRDRALKGRSAVGERSGRAKLRNADVERIREAMLFGATGTDLAAAFGVAHSRIYAIRNGHDWRMPPSP